MRKAWALSTLIVMLPMAPKVLAIFGRFSGLPQAQYFHPYRFSLLFLSDSSFWVLGLYSALILCCLCVLVRVRTRAAMIIGFILFASFVERDVSHFHAEAHVLLTTGFILSLWCAFFPSWPVMPAWLHRLILWQVMIIYVSAFWYKLASPEWLSGDATSLVLLHSTFFTAFTSVIAKTFATLLVLLTYALLAGEGAWILLLIPGRLESAAGFPRLAVAVRRTLLCIGAAAHILWALVIPGVYPLTCAMLTMYCGLLTPHDFALFSRKQ